MVDGVAGPRSGRPVLVLGASGNVGSAVTRKLAAIEGVIVRAFYDPLTPQSAAFPDVVEEIHGTFDDAAALRAAMEGADAVFMLTPPSESQVGWQRTMVDAARDQRVRRIVKLSAFETGADSPLQMGRWHHDGEVAVAESGLEYVLLRPQYFMQMLVPALTAAARTGVFRGAASGDTRLGLVDVDDIAAVAVVALTSPEHEGEVLVPTGPAAPSFDEMAAELADVIDREVRYVQRPAEEVAAELTDRGWPEWHIADFFKIHGKAASPMVTDCVQKVAGIAPHYFTSFLRARTELLLAQT